MPPADDPIRTRLGANLATVRERIAAAAARGAHAAEAVTLLPVTKAAPQRIFADLLALGEDAVGENRILEARERRQNAPEGLIWHGIGHLQRNKLKVALEVFDVLHGIDSLRLIDPLARQLRTTGRRQAIYLQVNAANDPRKGGFHPDEALEALRVLAQSPHVEVLGFMTMAALGSSQDDARATFRTLREIRDEAVRAGVGQVPPQGLSMGMTNDFEIAVEEGATIVRIGSALLEGLAFPDAASGAPDHP